MEKPVRLGIVCLALIGSFLAGCSNSGTTASTATTTPAVMYSASVSASALNFTAFVGMSPAGPAQNVILTNTGTGTLTLASFSVSGVFSLGTGGVNGVSACSNGGSLASGTSCSVAILFAAPASGTYSGTLTFADNATAGNQTVSLTGVGTSTASAANTVDCSVATGFCAPTFTTQTLASDPIASGGFHGYADPSERKDPNAAITYLAYSWAHTLTDGTHVVDLHLASSSNSGMSFNEVGTLWTTATVTQTISSAYSQINDTSHEVIDLIPVPLTGTSAGQTMWVQAHEEYLVAPQAQIYAQGDQTLYVSLSAVQVATPATPGTALLGLSSAPEAHLGGVSVDPTRNITQSLTALSPALSKCATLGQPALWYQTGTLYLGLECGENATLGSDTNELAHYLFTTTPTGAVATKWTWFYAGIFATPAQAGKLGALSSEGVAYQFFTEPEFVQTKSGQLAILLTPSIFAPPTGSQPVIQYGCRVVPVTALSTSGITLATDTISGALSVTAKITESDLYTGVNEGPAACTYEPTAVNGIIIGRKYENDPTYGFYIYPVNTGIFP